MLSEQTQTYFSSLQATICHALEALDTKERFREDRWSHAGGGGGRTRILQQGGLFEKAGVNFSAVESTLSGPLASRMKLTPQKIFATGISLVIHPFSPMIPTVHMNLRYLQLENKDAWFGGGMDLTPWYLFEDDARHFHQTIKSACDKQHPSLYPRFKRECDEYFFIRHRNETRGIGGIFFDYQREEPEEFFEFIQLLGSAFLDSYLPIVRKRAAEPWTQREKDWQLVRRGRYAEFNLVYDRGTLFGLETQGRTESILMSLPPEVRWRYDEAVEPHSREAALMDVLQHPREWI